MDHAPAHVNLQISWLWSSPVWENAANPLLKQMEIGCPKHGVEIQTHAMLP